MKARKVCISLQQEDGTWIKHKEPLCVPENTEAQQNLFIAVAVGRLREGYKRVFQQPFVMTRVEDIDESN